MEYKLKYDYHTHTKYSHGKGTILDNVKVAFDKGLSAIAITDHGPGHKLFGLDLNEIKKIRDEINDANIKYPSVKVLLGVEANLTNREPFMDINQEENKLFDIVLLGYHYGIKNSNMLSNVLWSINHRDGLKYEKIDDYYQAEMSPLLVKNTTNMLNALNMNRVNILTHPGDKGPFCIYDIASACERTGTFLEINLKHPHLSIEELKVSTKFNVKYVISSDAHEPKMVGEFKEQLERALASGIDIDRIVNIEKI